MRIFRTLLDIATALTGIALLCACVVGLAKQPGVVASSPNASADENDELNQVTSSKYLDISVRKERVTFDNDRIWYIVITGKSDLLKIRTVQINRGNCRRISFADGLRNHSAPLRFGESYKLMVVDCDPLEIRVNADQGTATYVFN